MTPTCDQPHPLRLRAEGLRVGYGARDVLPGIDVSFADGQMTAIVGPNGCGKSTLLKTLARVLTPTEGTVLLDGYSIHRRPTREVAKRIGLLPQSTVTPEQLTVADLVGRGRYPHRGPFARWTDDDHRAVEDAFAATDTADLRTRLVDELSGGQRQRVWIAMVLAQHTPLLLLDEPTTYLDLGHRLEVLRLLRRLNHDRRVTVIMVLHDLHEATRHADQLIAMADGEVVAQGPPATTVTPALVRDVFGVHCTTIPCPVTGVPLIIPLEADQENPTEPAGSAAGATGMPGNAPTSRPRLAMGRSPNR